MTEVREDKGKNASGNLEESREDTKVESHQEPSFCSICGREFKNERARKTHEHHCRKRRQENHGGGDNSLPKNSREAELRQDLIEQMEAIRKERLFLMDERRTFLEEMERERARLRDDVRHLENQEQEAQDVPKSAQRAGNTGDYRDQSDLDLEIAGMEKELERIDPETENITKKTQSFDIEDLTIELENLESELTTKVDFNALSKMADDFHSAMEKVEDDIRKIHGKIDSLNDQLDDNAGKFGTHQNIVRELRRLDEKTLEILEEIGFGESLNVSKIPPNILESVYDSTIEDVVSEIRRNHGTYDSEAIVNRTLEDIRTRTSGSELFYYDGRILRTRNLAKAISGRLISAKQVQTTYDELLNKLLEYIPGYKAKNFRAMIKLKSQEYAVDKTTSLLDRNNLLKEEIDHLKNMVGSVSNRQNTIEMEINRVVNSLTATDDIKGLREETQGLKNQLADIVSTLKGIQEELKIQKETIQKSLHETKKPESKPEKELKERKEAPKFAKEGIVELVDEVRDEIAELVELTQEEKRIFQVVPVEGCTLNRIKKELDGEVTESRIKKCLQSLMDKGVMSTEKRGRHTIYVKTEVDGGEN